MDLPTAIVALIVLIVIAYVVTIIHEATVRTLRREGEETEPAERLIAWPRWLTGMVAILLVIWLLYAVWDILLPFLLAAIFAYILNPLIAGLERRGWPRHRAVWLVFIGFLALLVLGIVLLIPQIIDETRNLTTQYNEYAASAREFYTHFRERVAAWGRLIGVVPAQVKAAFADIGDRAQAYVQEVLRRSLDLLKRSLFVVILLVVTPVVTFWLLRDYTAMRRRFLGFLPEDRRHRTDRILHDINGIVGGYLLGMALMMLIVGVFAITVLSVAGVTFAILLGIMTGVLYVIPYIGFPTSVIIIALTMAVTGKSVGLILIVLGVLIGGNIVADYVVTPRVVGRRVGLHPLVVIFSILAGGALLNFIGIVLAIPIAGTIKVVLMHFWPEFFSPDETGAAPA